MFNKDVLRNFSYGVYVISAMDIQRPTGCVANCAVQLTYDSLAVSLNHNNYTNKVIKTAGEFSISILSQNSNPDIISVFGFTSGKDKNKFENFEYKTVGNSPVLLDSVGYLTLKTVQVAELETHTLFIAKILEGDVIKNEPPMTYKYYHEKLKGNAPKAAPTYVEPVINNTLTEKYRCSVCGYIYEGDISREAPNFVCPVCKQPKSVFEPIALA